MPLTYFSTCILHDSNITLILTHGLYHHHNSDKICKTKQNPNTSIPMVLFTNCGLHWAPLACRKKTFHLYFGAISPIKFSHCCNVYRTLIYIVLQAEATVSIIWGSAEILNMCPEYCQSFQHLSCLEMHQNFRQDSVWVTYYEHGKQLVQHWTIKCYSRKIWHRCR